jgi:hypothetical protein
MNKSALEEKIKQVEKRMESLSLEHIETVDEMIMINDAKREVC